ncbi:Prostaglandin E synthase 2 [Heracleum sosnowskyi]|uniref:Prostaglandin E synthase 2 n=1 Tax=Heracleum sosnowskyi TaxID=360622 RepID=A0AAD8HPU3_9APIA|nr:Prostaglandin E synthase 2 [Heracleum sosnowskyi]
MNRAAYNLASLALSRSFLSGGHSAAVFRPRLLLTARLFSSAAAPSMSPASSKWLTPSIAVAGGIIAGAGVATYLEEQVYAKEMPMSPEKMPKEVVLYQYEACPFCNKVKAFMDYYDVPYKIVEVNPLSKKEIKWSDYKKVPILMVDGQQMNDSSAIIDKLDSMINSEKSAKEVPDNDEEKQWRSWVDNHLVHMLSPNIYRTTSEALESFDYITSNGNFSFTEKYTVKYAGAAAMYFVSKNLKKKYNITDERASLYEAAEQWVNALNGREFLGGAKPNLADLAVFGVLRPIRYLRSGIDMVENTQIGDWYARMESVVGESSRIVT